MLYQKYRPQSFDEVRGQEPITTTLRNQVMNGRTAHAYLFCGTRGTGKTSIAKILARAVNCEHPINGSPCNCCSICKGILENKLLNVVEMDAASNNGVDTIRQICDEVKYSPTDGKYRVYIIDEVHMLSTGAFNALLKTLEEPPEYVKFILATTELHKVPQTILSRCQRFEFKRISNDEIAKNLRDILINEQILADARTVNYIAKCGDGSMRDSLSLLDQCIAGGDLTFDNVLALLGAVDAEVISHFFRKMMQKDVSGLMKIIEKVHSGSDLMTFADDVVWYLRNIMALKSSKDIEIDVSTEARERLLEECEMISLNQVIQYINIFSSFLEKAKKEANKKILFEVTVITLCSKEETDPAIKIKNLCKEGECLVGGEVFPAGTPYYPLMDFQSFYNYFVNS